MAIITACAETLSNEVKADPELARRALHVFSKAERQAENVDACLTLAFEDLRNRDEPFREGSAEPDLLDNVMLDRWEYYACGATTDQLRERWGRVLASEVRAPGTFSLKCLRIIDELDSEVAKMFERFCQHRIRDWVPECISAPEQHEIAALQDAGLVLHGDLGHTIDFEAVEAGDGAQLYFLQGDQADAIGLKRNAKLPAGGLTGMLRSIDGRLSLPIYVLTAAGRALASIIPRQRRLAMKRLSEVIQAASEPNAVFLYQWAGDRWTRSNLDSNVDGNREDSANHT
ncbi:DUF2806 domain-containing protein [Sinorhizobium meliloti]|uniref:DUF2806 domain-containing protein n=1 Tax=Rhizobium meliloti TaxID=382 RepID=UPI0013E39E95|nr:DUF2806 domain-containing protein [Sinorhizobium meliloti]